MSTPPAQQSSVGTWVAALVILAVVVAGALYFWGQRGVEMMDDAGETAALQSINTQSSSDEAAAIEADLNATDIDTIDAELNAS